MEDDEAVGRAGWVALALGVGTMCISSLVLIGVPRLIAGLFLDPAAPGAEAVMQSAITLLALAGLFQVADGAQVVLAGMLRGLGDTRITMMIAAAGYWGWGCRSRPCWRRRSARRACGIGLVVGLFATAAMLLVRWRSWRRAPRPSWAP